MNKLIATLLLATSLVAVAQDASHPATPPPAVSAPKPENEAVLKAELKASLAQLKETAKVNKAQIKFRVQQLRSQAKILKAQKAIAIEQAKQ